MLTNLNRIGIFLSFLAGFMLAPELIGLDRIRKLEAWIESRLVGIKQRIVEKSQKLMAAFGPMRVLLGATFGFLLLLIFYIIILLFGSDRDRYFHSFSRFFDFANRSADNRLMAAIGITLIVGACLLLYDAVRSRRRDSFLEGFGLLLVGIILFINPDFGSLLVLIVMTVPVIVVVLFFTFIILIILSLTTINKVINKVLSALEADGRLQGYIVTSGIALYIAGNICQLIATF